MLFLTERLLDNKLINPLCSLLHYCAIKQTFNLVQKAKTCLTTAENREQK